MKYMYHYLKAALLLLCLISVCRTEAQTTGSFDTDITFMAQARKLSLFVPANYNPAVSYRLMVCLHGAGDNSVNYRNGLISSLAFNTAFTNTIFVCPDGGSDQSKDFYTPAGDEGIIQEAINYAKANYNINNSNIILQGFSLGGRSALRYGLNNPAAFKGLLLNTPAVQGVKDALRSEADGGFKYSAAAGIPIYITHGGQDILYGPPIDSMYEKLVLHNSIAKLVRIPSMGHNIPPLSNVPDVVTYFDSPIPTGKDVEIVKVYVAPRNCNAQASLSVLIRNAATVPVTTVNFQYAVGSTAINPQFATWNGNLAPFEHAIVTLSPLTIPAGESNIEVTVASSNLTSDPTGNNTLYKNTEYASAGKQLPLTEGFEGSFPPQGWIINPAGDAYSAWVDDNQVKKSGTKSMNAFNTILIFDNATRKEEIISPVLDLTSIADPLVSFDVSYNYLHYTPQVLGVDSTFADTLEVLVSTDCGQTYTSIYKKGGAQLATFPAPIENAVTIDAGYTFPKEENWRGERISLANYAGAKEAMVAFRYISALGGCINIDNVSFTNRSTGIETVSNITYNVYPNPASDKVMVTAGTEIVRVDIMDMTGKKVATHSGGNMHDMTINTANLNEGMYIMHIVSKDGIHPQKIVIKK